MMRIRREQREVLQAACRARFEKDACAFVRALPGQPLANLDDAALAAWVADRIGRAQVAALEDEDAVLRWLQLSAIDGDDFVQQRDVVLLLGDPAARRAWPETHGLLQVLGSAAPLDG